MSFPVMIPLGPWQVHPHRFFETLAYLLGGQIFWILRRRWADALPGSVRMSVVAGAVLGAGLGAKGLHALTTLPMRQEVGWAAVWGGKSILGGILGGVLGVEVAKRLVGESRRTGDLFVVPLCLGIAVGRLGCFLSGMADGTHGGATSLPWGVDFGDGIPRHPTQLYEAVFLVMLLGVALIVRRKMVRSGDLWRWFLAAYCTWRLAVDNLKAYPQIGGLNGIQWAALAGLGWLIWERVRERSAGPPPAGQEGVA